MYHAMSTDELLRELECSDLQDHPLIKELSLRLESDPEETIDGKTDKDYTEMCVSHMQDVAGEDFHSDILTDIQELEDIKKKADRKVHIARIAGRLDNMDREAMELMESIKHDGVFL